MEGRPRHDRRLALKAGAIDQDVRVRGEGWGEGKGRKSGRKMGNEGLEEGER